MSDRNPTGSAMGDIIGTTRQRLEEPASPAERLKSLVAATAPAKSVATPLAHRESSPAVLPGNYFPQVAVDVGIVPKRKPQRGPSRSLHISMRLSPPERDRLVKWCDERNLSLPDGIIALLDLADGEGEGT
ncbi:MAG: hypothetical protein V4521_16800 [Pseudomonadota bacterium]|nr:MAG: hypothetical protein B7Y74_05600 [Novosphingobium sp. 35-62-5]